MKPYLFPNSNQIRDCVAKSEFNHLLLAVSGGLDSICLAHYFIKNKEILGIEWLGIAHIHHGLRDASADRDAKFVQNFAERYNIPFFLKKLDGKALKASEGSLEEMLAMRDTRRFWRLLKILQAAQPLSQRTMQGIKQKQCTFACAEVLPLQASTAFKKFEIYLSTLVSRLPLPLSRLSSLVTRLFFTGHF